VGCNPQGSGAAAVLLRGHGIQPKIPADHKVVDHSCQPLQGLLRLAYVRIDGVGGLPVATQGRGQGGPVEEGHFVRLFGGFRPAQR
jgi:hypothetical protein